MTSIRRPPLALRVSVIAVQGALALFAAMAQAQAADDPTVADLVTPRSTVEVGGIYVDKSSYKFSEYNGLQRQGLNPNASFELRGGGAYDSGSNERWRVFGSDLGLDMRSFGADYSRQGQFRLKFNYDELRRNYSDDFRTLWNGAGSSSLTLPAGYPSVANRTGNAGLSNWNNIQAPNLNATTTGGGPGYVIPALMQDFNVSTTRKRTGVGGELVLTRQWTVSVNARNEKKDGTKLTGAAFGGFKGSLLPEPIDSDTNTVDAVARYTTRQSNFSLGYSASFYRNHIDGWTAQSPFSTAGSGAVLNNMIMMNGAPDNQMHQLFADGGYKFSPTTQLVMSASHTRMTQNEAFHFQQGTGWNVNGGATSSDSKEVQTNFLARLTSRPITGLDLTAAYKIDYRDNRSPVGTYKITQYDGTATPSASTTFTNVPLNRKQQQLSLDARYSSRRGQSLSAGFEHVRIERTADASIDPLSHEINNPFASGKAREDTLKFGYRQAISEAVAGQLSYARSQRRAVDYEEPQPNPPTASSNVGAFAEVPGFRQFFLSDRNRDKLRGSLDFQVSDALSIQAGVDYLNDAYPSRYGLKKSGGHVLNLDGTYAASEVLSFTSFLTAENMKSLQDQFQIPVARVTTVPAVIPHTPDGTCASYSNATGLPSDYLTDPCRNWSEGQADRVFTMGVGVKSSRWLGGRLTLSGDIVYSRARTQLSFTGGTYYSNGLTSNIYIPAQNMPDITSTMTDLRLAAHYAIDKKQAVKVAFLHRRLNSSDPQFDLFGVTAVQAYIGSGMSSPTYRVNAISVSYVYTFR
jgi:MtrB/PioB family decaheme-associated outer membrane protein